MTEPTRIEKKLLWAQAELRATRALAHFVFAIDNPVVRRDEVFDSIICSQRFLLDVRERYHELLVAHRR